MQKVLLQYRIIEHIHIITCIEHELQKIKTMIHSLSILERIDYDSSAHILLFYTENVTNTTIMTECISIDILDDSSIEDIETFKVDIIVVNSYAATVENRSSAIVTIAENDKYCTKK